MRKKEKIIAHTHLSLRVLLNHNNFCWNGSKESGYIEKKRLTKTFFTPNAFRFLRPINEKKRFEKGVHTINLFFPWVDYESIFQLSPDNPVAHPIDFCPQYVLITFSGIFCCSTFDKNCALKYKLWHSSI